MKKILNKLKILIPATIATTLGLTQLNNNSPSNIYNQTQNTTQPIQINSIPKNESQQNKEIREAIEARRKQFEKLQKAIETKKQQQLQKETKLTKSIGDIEPSGKDLKKEKNPYQIFNDFYQTTLKSPQLNLIEKRLKSKYINYNSKIIQLHKLNPSLSNLLNNYSQKYKINPKLLQIIAIIESNFGTHPNNKSKKGAQGPLQVLPENIKHYGEKTGTQNHKEITAAINLLKEKAKVFKIDINKKLTPTELLLLLASYNTGQGNVKNYPDAIVKGRGNFSETQEYIMLGYILYFHYNLEIATQIAQENGIWTSKKTTTI